MKKEIKTITFIRWTARILGSLILLFILFFLFAHLFGEEESGEGFRNTQEVIMFLFFPISTFLGLSLALKWEGLGGIITTLGIIGLFVLRPDLIPKGLYIAAPIVPGILYIMYWLMTKKSKPAHTKS